MIVDSSALLAIVYGEPEAKSFLEILSRRGRRQISSATLLEARISVYRRGGDAGLKDLQAIIGRAQIEVIPFSAEHAEAGIKAHQRFGKGKHPAQLNFGDCIAYATAELAREPLLFKGEDFAHTDIASALAPARASSRRPKR